MQLHFTSRGKLVLLGSFILIIFSLITRSPTLILLTLITHSYLFAYPLYFRTKSTPNLELEARLRHNIIYRGEVDILHLRIENHGENTIPLLVINIEMPVELMFVNHPKKYKLTVKRDEKQILNIPIIGVERGEYYIEAVEAKLEDPFGIYANTIRRVKDIPIKIYPKRISQHTAYSRAKNVVTKLIGLFASKQRGMGTDFHGLRDYIRGDPSKIVAWNATARANKMISKEFEEEKKLEIIIGVAGGATTRGDKFDFMLGAGLEIYEHFVDEAKPTGFVVFDKKIRAEFLPSPSTRRVKEIWATTFDMKTVDFYADYNILDEWVKSEGITNTLFIILGDLEGDYLEMEDHIRNIKLRGNFVIFLDVWGYSFNLERKILDKIQQGGKRQYNNILYHVIGKGIKQYNQFRGLEIKKNLAKYKVVYGYISGPDDNIIDSIDRGMLASYGAEWKRTK